MVVERHFEFMVDNPGAVLGVSQSEFINRLLLFDDTIRKYRKKCLILQGKRSILMM